MIRRLKDLKGLAIGALDGAIGKVKDAYFDDSEWVVRYLVVDTGTWLSGRTVLISPLFITGVDWIEGTVQVSLSRAQVKDSPAVDFDKPVSRQQEAAYYRHYQALGYWAGSFVWGRFPYPGAVLAEREGAIREDHGNSRLWRGDRNVEDAHLRSAKEVSGYHIQALDGSIGHVEDFLFDDKTWLIEMLMVDTRNWLPGRHVMIPPDWIREVDWIEQSARVTVRRKEIQEQPEYPDDFPVRGSSGNDNRPAR